MVDEVTPSKVSLPSNVHPPCYQGACISREGQTPLAFPEHHESIIPETSSLTNQLSDKPSRLESPEAVHVQSISVMANRKTGQEIEKCFKQKMEAFKAVEKEMKTKAFSKEGLTAAAKLDPKDKEKLEVRDFLDEMTAELGRQVESTEAEIEHLQGQVKKSKRDTGKAERVSELEETVERHKWHQGKLELLIRALDNDSIDAEQVKSIEDGIKDYVDNNQEVDFVEDEYMYEDFNLDEAEEQYGVPKDLDKTTSHEDTSPIETPLERVISTEPPVLKPGKSKTLPDIVPPPARRPSQQIKSPLPALADMGKVPTAPAPPPPNNMRPAPPPSVPSGGPLKYASAAAVAIANDKAGIGIAPLPPPPGIAAPAAALPQLASAKASAANSPAPQTASLHAGSISTERPPVSKSPVPSSASISAPSPAVSTTQPNQTKEEFQSAHTQNGTVSEDLYHRSPNSVIAQDHDRPALRANGMPGVVAKNEESIYHLPASLQELVDSLDATRNAALPASHPEHQRQLIVSMTNHPDTIDAEKPRHYKPQNASFYTPPHYPQVPLPIFDDPRLYNKIDTDSLFYSFYYRQNTFQQYLAAKALKGQSWRFHKQYQTWFQRHEEPKHITEDFEQGTYRFFDYESTCHQTMQQALTLQQQDEQKKGGL
ncbi:hypothetical protein FH972_025757 [Carpinus fangiana]|uniref:NOT2/NOT3/NOT5 C-terminal domain-containing protein n=1 Tax=Carpinus fangiana TaxID=176857 RepID=A0A5N6L2Y2_9ROSI|nr:hypothetical protein FH972_025757 [Carpinus fangiana]